MDLGQQLVEFDFHFITSIFKNNDSFKIITIIDDMNLAEFAKQYGENLLPILGVSPTNAIKSAKGIELFQKNDRWIVLDKLIK